jgi:cell wall-associated NlpC family hydrolase/SLT domain-containing protein
MADEIPAGQGMLGVDQLQRQVDSLAATVGQLTSSLDSFVTRLGAALGAAEKGTAGASATSTGISSGARAGTASGTGAGGYSSWVSKLTTFGQRASGALSGAGGGRGGGFATFGSSSSANTPTAPGGGFGYGDGGWRGAVGIGAGVLQVAGAYGSANLNNFVTMNTAATRAMWTSGLANGGMGASLAAATRMIYGTGGSNINATAASVQDAASAAGLLSYGVGSPMYNANGSANASWLAGQSNMYAMGYANPYMSQTQVASAMNSMYSPRSIQMMAALGYRLPATGAVNASTYSPMQVAQSVFGRTFQGQSSVSSNTMAAALSQGGSLDSNLRYLAAQSGWSSSTVGMLETYLSQRNIAIQKGANPSTIDDLLNQAARGSNSAQSQLSKYGIGASTVQSIKNLQAAQTSNLADQSGSFNDTLQQSTTLLTQFNEVLGAILSSTGASSLIGGVSGVGSAFGGMASSAAYLAGSGGMGYGGYGGFGSFSTGGGAGGMLGMAGNIGANVAGNYALGRVTRWGSGRIASGWNTLRSRFGSSAAGTAEQAAGESESAAMSAGGVQEPLFEMGGQAGRAGVQGTLFDLPEQAAASESAAAAAEGTIGAAGGLSLGAGVLGGAGIAYGGAHLNNWLASNVYGHTGAGDSWVSSGLKVAGNTAAYAGAGALVGSVVPVVGTAAGAIIGGAIGLGQGLYDWISGGSGYSAANSSPAAAASSPSVPAGYDYTTGSIGGGTDNGTTSTAGPSSVTPALGASNATSSTVSRVVAAAVAQVGKPYVHGATGPDAFDCSGLMQFAYKQAGISIPRTSEQQMAAGSPVKPSEALPGDLMFPYPGHVMMCIGGGKVVEARHSGTVVWIRGYSPGEFVAARRIVQIGSSATQNTAASGGNAATTGNATDTMTSGSGLAAGTSELQALELNAQAATTDKLTASLRMSAADSPFGATSLTSTFGANPFAGTAAGAPGASGSTQLTGTVKDAYGHTYKVPSGKKPAGTVQQWITTALTDMNMPLSPDNIGDIKDIITGESSGDPWSINLYDSNAAAGHPSEGIMQTIPSTFAAHAMAGHKDIWNPVDNIIAGVRYAIATYKSLDNVPGVKAVKAGKPYVGYAAGAWDLPSDQIAQLHKGEMVLPASAAQSVRNAVISDALGQGSAGAAAKGSSGVTLHFRPGSIQISIGGQVTAQTAQQTGSAIVDAIVGDPRIKAMAVGM